MKPKKIPTTSLQLLHLTLGVHVEQRAKFHVELPGCRDLLQETLLQHTS